VEAPIIAGDANPTDRRTGIFARYSTSGSDGYLAQINGSQVQLSKFVGGVETSLGTWTTSWIAGATINLRLEAKDATKKVFVDTTERISSTDNSITAANKAALRIRGKFGGDWAIDNLTATDITAGATHNLLLSDASSAGNISVSGLTQTHITTAASASAGGAIDVAAAAQTHGVMPAAGVASSAIASATCSQAHQLVAPPLSAQAMADAALISQVQELIVDLMAAQGTAGDVAISQGAALNLAVLDIAAAATVDVAVISQTHEMLISALASVAAADAAGITQGHKLGGNAAQAQAIADALAITQAHALLADDAFAAAAADAVALITGGLGAVSDPSIVSLTAIRTAESLTRKLTITQL